MINEVSNRVNLSQKRIREYEKAGLIKPNREKNTNNRLYSQFEIDQILEITKLIHERGFTVSCVKNFMVHAPCWNIFDCKEKELCNAFQLPWKPCYEVREDRFSDGLCSKCPVYLNRDVKKEKVLEKFPSEGI